MANSDVHQILPAERSKHPSLTGISKNLASSSMSNSNYSESSALQLSETLLKILEYLADDKASLCSAILVNHNWAEEGTNVLWRYPPVAALASVPPGRRQIYAGKIYALVFMGDDDGIQHASFKDLRFPRLKSVDIDFYHGDNEAKLWIGQYLQPSLERFFLYGGNVAEDFLDLLESHCPRLQKVLIEQIDNPLDPEHFLAFLKSCKSLVSMSFETGMDNVLTDKVLFYLAGRENVETLGIGKLLRYAVIEDILQKIEKPFEHLQQLKVRLESSAVPSLVLVVKSIVRLVLEIEDDEHQVLQNIASMENLKSLEVIFCCSQEILPADIMALQSLNDLRKLVIQPAHKQELQAFRLTDEDIDRLTSSLRQLQHLSFQVQSNATMLAIKSIGEHCKLLNTCELLGSYDMQALKDFRAPIFPEIEELELDSAEVEQVDER